MPCGIMRCYLPPGRADIPTFTFTRSKIMLVLNLATPEGHKAELTRSWEGNCLTESTDRFTINITSFCGAFDHISSGHLSQTPLRCFLFSLQNWLGKLFVSLLAENSLHYKFYCKNSVYCICYLS